MNRSALRRDVLIISEYSLHPDRFEEELMVLGQMIDEAETPHKMAIATEVFDINRFKTNRKPAKVEAQLLKGTHRPFVFFCNKN